MFFHEKNSGKRKGDAQTSEAVRAVIQSPIHIGLS
jgi:hypothetical protein